MGSPRSVRKRMAEETLSILETGEYQTPTGAPVSVAEPLRRSFEETYEYGPDEAPPSPPPGSREARIEVVNETTLAGARALVEEGHDVMVLNFASAKNPGGGFLGGAEAQEEFLARSSGLFACLRDRPMYALHRSMKDCLYTSAMLYSPGVPVFRDDAGALLEEPYTAAFVSAPAVNAGVVLERDPGRAREVRETMRQRIEKVLAIAAEHDHDALVLGAWGCGVFRNDPEEIAGLFAAALRGRFAGVFARVRFSVLDRSPDERYLGPFRAALG